MTRLVNTQVKHETNDKGLIRKAVGFDTDDGGVDLTLFDDGRVQIRVGTDRHAEVEDAAEILNAVADDEHMPAAAVETGFEILAAAEDSEDNTDEDDTEDAEEESTEEGDVVHVTDDGTEVRVGDKVNHPGGWSYKIAGRESEHTVQKVDFYDDNSEVSISTLESDIESHGFDERWGDDDGDDGNNDSDEPRIMTDGGEISKADTELVYKYLPERLRADVDYEAWSQTLDEWREDRPDDLDALEAANDDDDSPFRWDQYQLTFESSQVDGSDELVPHTMAGGATDDIYDAAHDFGWDYVENVRDEIRRMQSETNFSPKEFVAVVLSESHLTYAEAAAEMGITTGTYGSKMSREVKPEIESARKTADFVDRLQSE